LDVPEFVVHDASGTSTPLRADAPMLQPTPTINSQIRSRLPVRMLDFTPPPLEWRCFCFLCLLLLHCTLCCREKAGLIARAYSVLAGICFRRKNALSIGNFAKAAMRSDACVVDRRIRIRFLPRRNIADLPDALLFRVLFLLLVIELYCRSSESCQRFS
jgi:hypothetical protein